MTKTYPAVLRGGQIEWTGEIPQVGRDLTPIPVRVVIDGDHQLLSDEERVRRRMAALDRLYEMKAYELFGDPLEWQKEQRKDRPLPGRERDE
jgi:hypothetical protein